MTQSDEFERLAEASAAKAAASVTPSVKACYEKLAVAYRQVAQAYRLRPPPPPVPRRVAVRATRRGPASVEVCRQAKALQAMTAERAAQLLATMRDAVQAQQRYRTVAFETEITLLTRRR